VHKKKGCSECRICKEVFESITLKIEHTSVKHPERKIHYCQYCDFKCLNTTTLKKHEAQKHPKLNKDNKALKIYTCSLCSQDFKAQKNLNMHNKVKEICYCPVCSKKFCNLPALKAHQRKIHVNIPCELCDMIFDNFVELGKHKVTKHITPKKCEICGKMIIMNMKRHIASVHNNIKPFKCNQPNCSFSAKRKCNLDAHEASVHKQKVDYSCKICSKLFPSSNAHNESQYIKHYKAEHEGVPPEFKDKEQYLCSECPATFFKKSNFYIHKSIKHKNASKKLGIMKKFECKTCNMTLIGRSSYVEHCKDVHDEIISKTVETIECNFCEEKFRAPTFYIQHHQSVHGKLPPEYLDKELFVCDQCPQIFITKFSLSTHIYNGHNVKNKVKKKEGKKCPHCEKIFQNNNNYLEHVKSKHEKKTPFQCDECDRSYGTNKKLTNHKQLVHQRVKCEECDKEICNSFILKRHKASVHGIIPKDAYQCKKCTSFFSNQTSLDKHVTSKHSVFAS